MNRFPRPHVFMGDFNEEPNSVAYKVLVGQQSLAGWKGTFEVAFGASEAIVQRVVLVFLFAGHFLDSCAELSAEDGWTFTTLQKKPKKRIDFVLTSDDIRQAQCSVLAEDESASQTPASDHRPVIVEIKLK
jgi:endonuclease/exonuclease/phosphatase family metal-dependent hydrolase